MSSLYRSLFKQGSDNWGYVLSNSNNQAIAIDPLDEGKYISVLKEKKLRLVGILCTHYHEDHIQGIPGLLEDHDVPVYGPLCADAPSFVTEQVSDGSLNLTGFELKTHFLPGHSRSLCVYRVPKKEWLFVGDLIFHLGCGRVLDAPPELLFNSLQVLKLFSAQSEIFVGHDYRERNYAFCTQFDPKYYSALNLSDLGDTTSLEMELWWNPFLRASSFDEWWELRQKRNAF